jgi:hypothetical protein
MRHIKDMPFECLQNKPAILNTKRDQRWIDEAMASGPETPLTRKEMDAIRNRVVRRKK